MFQLLDIMYMHKLATVPNEIPGGRRGWMSILDRDENVKMALKKFDSSPVNNYNM